MQLMGNITKWQALLTRIMKINRMFYSFLIGDLYEAIAGRTLRSCVMIIKNLLRRKPKLLQLVRMMQPNSAIFGQVDFRGKSPRKFSEKF